MNLHTKKQLLYFGEVIRLHFEEGLKERRISARVPVSETTIKRWITQYQVSTNPSQFNLKISSLDLKIKKMHDSGISMRDIGSAIGLSKSTISSRIAKFAVLCEEQDMSQSDKKKSLVTEQDAQARIVELEEKLRKAELARDAYDEMINVAEAKFNIPIRKKAGAKQ